jgi:hypothetical protein
MDLLGGVGQMEDVSISADMVLISAQDLCTVWAERATGSEIILGAPD